MPSTVMIDEYYNPDAAGLSCDKVAHLAWCALAALYMRKQVCGEMDSKRENYFLMRWFALAIRKNTFPQEYAGAFRYLLQNWVESGLPQQLHPYLLHIWLANC